MPGLGEKKIGVAYETLTFGTDDKGQMRITTPLTRDAAKQASAFEDTGKS